MDAINAKGMTYAYTVDEEMRIALSDVTFCVKKGEFVAILGHNGSGKSTLAKNINVLLTPQHGELYVMGLDTKDENNTWEIRREAGMVFQNPDNQIVSTIVEEDIAFGPENLGLPREEIVERVHASLAAVEMEGFEKRAPHMLSGGQKQRIAIAGVLALYPDIIVFDEPTAMLDPVGREEVMKTIRALNEQGKTIVLITHYMEEATGADRVFVMNEGKIIDEGPPGEVFFHTDKIEEAGLLPPFATQLYLKLQQDGLELTGAPITLEQLVEALCHLK